MRGSASKGWLWAALLWAVSQHAAAAPVPETRPALRWTPEAAALAALRHGPAGALNLHPDWRLAGFDRDDRPVYYETHTLNAARTISLDELWPGGASGLGWDGAAMVRLGMWDAGRPLDTHQELQGRLDQMDDPPSLSTHSTLVAGVLVAQGLEAGVRGMAPAARLKCWDWVDDTDEQGEAAYSTLAVANCSYGSATGWSQVGASWYWYGDPALSPVEDAGFGRYSGTTRLLDELLWLGPELLMVRSAGNHRGDTGPAAGVPHFVYVDGQWVSSLEPRQPDGGADGYDSLGPEASAKNCLVVTSANDLPGGWTQAADVVLSTSASCGPTDDGRIKPDCAANGIALLTTSRAGNASYTTASGTSMASPNAAGAAALLEDGFRRTHAEADGAPRHPLASTLRGLLLHTAGEAGSAPGPDYRAGWGLVDARAAAELVAEDSLTRRRVLEGRMQSGGFAWMCVRALGGPLRATLCWTDPPGPVLPPQLDDPAPALVHDLDLELVLADGSRLRTWALDPAQPEAPAQAAGNHRDNVERLDGDLPEGSEGWLTIQTTGPLGSPQPWSLLLSGLEPVAQLVPTLYRPTAGLGDTVGVDLYLEGGWALSGARLDLRWPAGALRLAGAAAGPALGADGHGLSLSVAEEGLDRAVVFVERAGDLRGLDQPMGLLARLDFVLQSLGEIPLDLAGCRLVGAGGDDGHAIAVWPLVLNQGQDPPDLELTPEDLPPAP